MNERTLVSEELRGRQVHWTAKASCAFSVCMMVIFLLQSIDALMSPFTPLYQPLNYLMHLIGLLFALIPLSRFLSSLLPLSLLLVPPASLLLISFIFGGVALVISFRRRWRKGLGMAIVGVVLPGIILMVYGVLIVFLLFFWHPHLVF